MSDVIGQKLNMNCSALMGANLAHEVADEQFCETTIGIKNLSLPFLIASSDDCLRDLRFLSVHLY